jgi:chromate transporter
MKKDVYKKPSLLNLYLVFFKIALFGFGGGYSMLPALRSELCEKRDWVSEEELRDYYAVGQCTPGIIAVNTATFVGAKFFGLFGGVIATLGIITPSFLIMTALAAAYNYAEDLVTSDGFIRALDGIKSAVAAFILLEVWGIMRASVKGAKTALLFASAVLLTVAGISPVYVVVASLFLGFAGFVKTPENPKENEKV